MRFADSVRIAARKLQQRWGRTLFTAAAFAAALIPPILILDLLDGAAAVIQGGTRASAMSPRIVHVRKIDKSRRHRPNVRMSSLERTDLLALPGATRVAEFVATNDAYLYPDGDDPAGHGRRAITRFSGMHRDLMADMLAPGQSLDESLHKSIPVVLGRLALRYRYDEGELQRVDVDCEELIGKTLELHVGDIYRRFRRSHLIWDRAEQIRRPATAEETRVALAKFKRYQDLEFDLTQLESHRTLAVRVVGIAPGFSHYLPYETVLELRQWVRDRQQQARRDPSEPTMGEPPPALIVTFAHEEEAAVASETLRLRGYKVHSTHEMVRRAFERVEFAVYLVGGIALCVLLLACFMISSLITRMILDAKQEIGLLRAIGARQGHIMRICLLEALLTCGIGAVLAILVGNVGAWSLSTWVLAQADGQSTELEFMGMHMQLDQIDVLPTSLFRFAPGQFIWIAAAMLLASAATFFAARRSANLDPTQALRAE